MNFTHINKMLIQLKNRRQIKEADGFFLKTISGFF